MHTSHCLSLCSGTGTSSCSVATKVVYRVHFPILSSLFRSASFCIMTFLVGLFLGVIVGAVGLYLLAEWQTKPKATKSQATTLGGPSHYYTCEICGVRLLKKSKPNHLKSQRHQRRMLMEKDRLLSFADLDSSEEEGEWKEESKMSEEPCGPETPWTIAASALVMLKGDKSE